MSKNKLFSLAFDAVRETLYQYIRQVFIKRNTGYLSGLKTASALADATSDHRLILDTIRRRDYPACERIFLHMINFNEI